MIDAINVQPITSPPPGAPAAGASGSGETFADGLAAAVEVTAPATAIEGEGEAELTGRIVAPPGGCSCCNGALESAMTEAVDPLALSAEQTVDADLDPGAVADGDQAPDDNSESDDPTAPTSAALGGAIPGIGLGIERPVQPSPGAPEPPAPPSGALRQIERPSAGAPATPEQLETADGLIPLVDPPDIELPVPSADRATPVAVPAGSSATSAAPASTTSATGSVNPGVLRSEHVRVLRELAPNREVAAARRRLGRRPGERARRPRRRAPQGPRRSG